MLKETEKTAKTVDLAVAAACEALGVSADEVDVTVIDEPKKGILGIGAQDAKVLVALKRTPAVRAVEFVETLVSDMGLEAEVRVTEKNEEGITLSVEGKDLGMLIGRTCWMPFSTLPTLRQTPKRTAFTVLRWMFRATAKSVPKRYAESQGVCPKRCSNISAASLWSR